jgi:serine/threonine-protein kinase
VTRAIVGAASTKSDPAYELGADGMTVLQRRWVIYSITATSIAITYFPGFYLTWKRHPLMREDALLAHVLSPWTFVLLGVHVVPGVICRYKPLPIPALHALDLVNATAIGSVFGRVLTTHPHPVVAPLEGLLAIAAVLGLRALLIPSTGARTAIAGVLLCLGPAYTIFSDAPHFSASWLGVQTTGPLFVTWASVSVALTSVASAVLYGLRREVRDAQRLGQYTLRERLGEGGMGVVYRAEHALLRRPTAVKLLLSTERPESIARFEREVQLMAELTHPNTVAIYDYGRTADGVFYYAMEYLDGVDLEALMTVGGPQPASRVVHLLRQACSSLHEAHQRGLIHRDVKPANVFLCRGRSEPDTIKVLDFGLVKEAKPESPSLSTPNVVLGTPLYMSPESIATPDAVDARSDVYSLGAVAYLLITGTPVFSGTTVMAVCAKHLHEVPEAPSVRLGQIVPADLEAVILACLAKDPAARPPTALHLRSALDACVSAGSWRDSDAETWWRAHAALIEARRQAVAVRIDTRPVRVDPTRALQLEPDAFS